MCFFSQVAELATTHSFPSSSFNLSITMVTVHPITFHSITFHSITFHQLLGKTTFHPIHESSNTSFQLNYVSPNSRFGQTTSTLQFHRTFFIRLIHLAHIFIPIITHKPMDRFASNFD